MVSRLPFEAGGSPAPASWGSCGGSPGVSGKENQALEPTRHGFLWLPLAGGGGTWMDVWDSVQTTGGAAKPCRWASCRLICDSILDSRVRPAPVSSPSGA